MCIRDSYEGADDGSTVRDNADSGIVSRSTAKTLLQIDVYKRQQSI